MICTFYSYKGGVGRSMSLVNVAELMYRAGRKVIMVDWDLEAPGLERYYPERADKILDRLGIIDLLINYKDRASRYRPQQDKPVLSQEELKSCLIDLYSDSSSPGKLQLLSAGRRAGKQFIDYATRVKSFDWQDFYQNWEGEVYFEWLRTQLNTLADVVFIDARTGVTEMGGVCTYQMADIIVMLCAANQQNMDGTQRMLESFSSPQLPPLRQNRELKVLVVPARIERVAEIQTLNRFRQDFAKRFLPYMNQTSNQSDILVKLEIPYVPLYAFEEIIAVRQTSDEQRSVEMEVAYNQLAQLLLLGGVIKPQVRAGLLNYLNFDITITKHMENDKYGIIVHSPLGEVRTIMPFPFTDAELKEQLVILEHVILYSVSRQRKSQTEEERMIKAFGQRLFDFLLNGDARDLYYASLSEASNKQQGMRLRLQIQPAALTLVPWEFLYDPRRADYLCLNPYTPLVRYLELSQPMAPLTVTPPLQILGMVANPGDLPLHDLEREKAHLELATQELQERGLVKLTWLPGDTWRDLQRFMRSSAGPWHIFHFIGHGGFDAARDEGILYLANEQHQSLPISATQLSRLLAGQRYSLRLVVLNVFERARSSGVDDISSTAITLVQSGLPAVLGIQYAIKDTSAVSFTQTFYEAVADGLPIDTAVTDARNAVNLANARSLQWGAPALYMRTPDGILFTVETPPTSHVASASSSALGELRTILAALYSNSLSIRRLLHDVDMDASRISFEGSATNIWHMALTEANRTYKTGALLDAVSREYASNETFRTAAASYLNEQRHGKE